VRQASKIPERLPDRVTFETCSSGQRDGGGGVEQVVFALETDLAPEVRVSVEGVDEAIRLDADVTAGAEGDDAGARACAPGLACAERVARWDDHRVSFVHAEQQVALGVRVVLEGGVAVQVIRGDVEQGRGPGAERGHALGLEAGDLQDQRVEGAGDPRRREHLGQGDPEVSADEGAATGGLQDGTDEGGGGALAVGSSDGDRGRSRGEELPGEVQLAQRWDSARLGVQEGREGRNPRGDHDPINGAPVDGVVASGEEGGPLGFQGEGGGGEALPRGGVIAEDPGAAGEAGLRCGDAASTESDDRDGLSGEIHGVRGRGSAS
jgi:hypothetical protein